MTSQFIESAFSQEDVLFEAPLRPQSLDDFIGQPQVLSRLNIMIQAAKQRGETLGHCLFFGPPGLGKTTLASIVAKAMGVQIVITSGPVIEKAGDLAGLLTNLQEGDVLFIDELHRLNKNVEEYLYPAMEDFVLDIMIDSGPAARSVRVNLKKFTLVGATTRSGLLSSPMRSRFALSCRLEYYPDELLATIVERTARILNVVIEAPASLAIAARSRGTPRVANNLLRWVRDVAQVSGAKKIDKEVAESALVMLAIDARGLDEMDIKILTTILDHHGGGPVGVGTIAVAVGEEVATIEEVYEPYLIMQGFLKRTQRGREATQLAREHLKTRRGEVL